MALNKKSWVVCFIVLILLTVGIFGVLVFTSFPGSKRSAVGFAVLERLEKRHGIEIGIQMQSQFCCFYFNPDVNLGPIIEDVYSSELLDYYPEIQLVSGHVLLCLRPYGTSVAKESRSGWRLNPLDSDKGLLVD